MSTIAVVLTAATAAGFGLLLWAVEQVRERAASQDQLPAEDN